MLYAYIAENYKAGEPIFAMDIEVESSEEYKKEQLERLVAYRRLMKFAEGIYYIPEESKLAGEIALCPDVVARSKYICRKGKRIGYYGGYTLANFMGISSQVPVREEYISNAAQEKEKEVSYGIRTYVVRKPPVEVTEENYRILQLLEIMQDVERYADDVTMAEALITFYVKRNQVSRENIDKYIGYFSEQTYKNMDGMGLYHVFA